MGGWVENCFSFHFSPRTLHLALPFQCSAPIVKNRMWGMNSKKALEGTRWGRWLKQNWGRTEKDIQVGVLKWMHVENIRTSALTDGFCVKMSTLHSHQLLQVLLSEEDLLAPPRSQTVMRNRSEHHSSLGTFLASTTCRIWNSAANRIAFILPCPRAGHNSTCQQEGKISCWVCVAQSDSVYLEEEEEINGGMLPAQHCKNLDLPHDNNFWAVFCSQSY